MQTGLDPKVVAAMARAYDDLVRELRMVGRTDAVTEKIAEEIVRVAQAGVRDPAEIRARVLDVVRGAGPDGADRSSSASQGFLCRSRGGS